MSRVFFLSLCLCFGLAHAGEKTPANDRHDLAYSLGASLGERLRQEVPGLELKALLDGLQQAYQGKPLALKDERIEQILAEHEARTNEQSARPQSEIALQAQQRFLAQERAKPDVRELAGGILLTELKAGNGPQPSAEGSVQVRYVGRLPDGSVFDQNAQPQWFRLDSVISGWRSALLQMQVGATWRLVIPADQAYGAEGAGDLIAPFTPLVFEIELVNVR